jgi:uncharacterized protein YkwD
VPTGSPPRHRATGPGVQDPARRPGRRTRYLLCGLLVVPALIAGGLYLARGSGPAASPSAPGTAVALNAAGRCGPAAAESCPASPIHVSIATAPASAREKRPAARPAPPPAATSASRASARPTPPPAASSRPTVSATGPAGALPGTPVSQPGTPAGQVLALINQARSAVGLPPLTVTADLVASASGHTMTMAEGCGLSHQCPGEPPLGARETAAGVHWTAAGENIGEGGPVADTTAAIAQIAVDLTRNMLNETPPDDGHRLNILSTAFTHIGIAVYRDGSGTVWLTQDFSN